jgi:hypothetical protein
MLTCDVCIPPQLNKQKLKSVLVHVPSSIPADHPGCRNPGPQASHTHALPACTSGAHQRVLERESKGTAE